jgi:hypothetical protein
MKARQTQLVQQPGVQGGQIGIADEGFGICAHNVKVEIFEQVIRSVATTGTEDSANLGVQEGEMEIVQTVTMAAGEIAVRLDERVASYHRLEAEAAQRVDPEGDPLRLRVAGRRNNGDLSAARDRGNFEPLRSSAGESIFQSKASP